MTSFFGSIQGIGGGKIYPPKWYEIGYSGTPQNILDGFDYAKDIYDNWTAPASMASLYRGDKDLKYFPNVDITGYTNYSAMFQDSGIIFTEPLTLGDGSSTVVNGQWLFKNSQIESLEFDTADPDQAINLQDAFESCLNLKKIKTSSKISGSLQATFADCTQLKRFEGSPDLSGVTSMREAFRACSSLTYFPALNTGATTDFYRCFQNCTSLRGVNDIDLSYATNLQQMFWNCSALESLPFLTVSRATNLTNMFQGTGSNLADDSRINILTMCISAAAYTGTKTLAQLGFTSSMYSAASWQALNRYNDFVSAGWAIGYS